MTSFLESLVQPGKSKLPVSILIILRNLYCSSFKDTLLPKTSWLQIVLIQIWGQGSHLVQPERKICSSKWVQLPQIGMNTKHMWPHHLVIDLRPLFLIYWNSIAFLPSSYGARPTYCHCGSTAHLAKDAFNGAWICDAARSWACVQEQVCNAARLTLMNLVNTNHKIRCWYCWWKKACTSWYVVHPIIYRVLYISGVGGFLSINRMVGVPDMDTWIWRLEILWPDGSNEHRTDHLDFDDCVNSTVDGSEIRLTGWGW